MEGLSGLTRPGAWFIEASNWRSSAPRAGMIGARIMNWLCGVMVAARTSHRQWAHSAALRSAYHFDTRAKYAVAFPRMSRSILSRAFSARSLAAGESRSHTA